MTRFLLAFISFSFFSLTALSQVISTFPYSQDFESFSTCGTSCGNACALSSGWVNDLTDGLDWTVHTGATGSGSTGPSTDYNTGTTAGKYLYTETSGSCSGGLTTNLMTPYFSFTGQGGAKIDFWYHMFGATMGTMHFDVDTTQGQGSWVQDVVPAWTDNQDLWQNKIISLGWLAGLDSVRFRIRGVTGTSFTSDMAVDLFQVYILSDTDLTVSAITAPVGGCGLSATETVTISIQNAGADTFASGTQIPVSYDAGAGAVNEMLTLVADLNPGASINYSFTTTANLSTPGVYNLTAWTAYAGDTIASNDSLTQNITSIQTISSTPYVETFESGAGGWSASGTNATWALGVPTASVISTSHLCGDNAWVTNLNGPYNNSETSYLESPCIDFTSLSSDPLLRFSHIYDTESGWDETWVEISTNGGSTWSKLGAMGSGTNWYNNSSNYWEGNSGGWQIAEHPLTGTAGFSDVKIRFVMSSDGSVTYEGVGVDNIMIIDSNYTDLSPTAVIAPVSGCGLTASELVSVGIGNLGYDTTLTYTICYSINGGTAVCDSLTDTISAGGTDVHNFSSTADFSTPGTYDVKVWISAAGDMNTCNDTVSFQVISVPSFSSFPYKETFEGGMGGWASGGSSSTWAFGTPAKGTIIGAASGQNAWVTGGLSTGTYVNNEDSWVLGPCFDMTLADSNSWVALKVWWESEFSWDGANLQYSVDSGASWINVGAFGDPFNWYTDNTISGSPGGSSEGWSGRTSSSNGSGMWVQAKHTLPDSLRNYNNIRFRVNFGSDGSVTDDGFAFDDFAIGVPQNLSLGNDTTVCGGFTLDASSPAFAEWIWSTGDNTPSITLYNPGTIPDTMNITVEAIDTLGLSAWDTIQVIVQPTPYIDLGADTTICMGDTITLAADSLSSTSVTWSWSTGDTTTSIMASAEATYMVTIQDSLGGCAYTDSIKVMHAPMVSLPADTSICPGDTIMLMVNIMAGSVSWSNGDTTAMTAVAAGGIYTVEVWDMLGCYSTDTISIQQDSVPVAMFNFAVGGAGLTYNFTDISTGGPSAWSWDFGDGNNSGTQNPSHTYATSGSYNVTLIVTNACGVDTFVQNITVTGVTETLGEGQVGIYPNPNKGQFDVVIEHISDEAEIVITDMLGHVVYHRIQHGSGKTEVSLTGEAKGIYFVRIRTGADQVIKKVVVE